VPIESGAITIEELLREDHHRYYGRPWIMGRYYADALVVFGLKQSERVLDIGCGAGRTGCQLIPRLEPGRYFGIDAHLRSLIAFAGYEIFVHNLKPRMPRLLLSRNFEFEAFGGTFDVALDFSVTHHLPQESVSHCYKKLRSVMDAGGRAYLVALPRISLDEMEALGFQLNRTRTIRYPLLAEMARIGPKAIDEDTWYEFVAI